MITPSYSATATERVLPRLALDFTTGVLDPRVTVTRALNTATRTNASGILEIVNANLPRFDYDPSTLTCKGLLIEESRTNILLNSLINGTVLSTQIVTVSATAYTISFYGTGTITLSGAHVAVVTGSGAYPSRKTYTFTPTAGALTVTVTGTVQFAQLEAGAFATSYIPTTTSSLTRNADVVQMTGSNFSSWYNAGEGTFAEWFTFNGFTANAMAFSVTDGTLTNLIQAYWSNSTTINMDGGVSATMSLTAAQNTASRLLYAYKLNNYAAAINAGAVTTDTSGTPPPTMSQLNIGNRNGSLVGSAHFAKLMYWPQRLTNAEVQAFSK